MQVIVLALPAEWTGHGPGLFDQRDRLLETSRWRRARCRGDPLGGEAAHHPTASAFSRAGELHGRPMLIGYWHRPLTVSRTRSGVSGRLTSATPSASAT